MYPRLHAIKSISSKIYTIGTFFSTRGLNASRMIKCKKIFKIHFTDYIIYYKIQSSAYYSTIIDKGELPGFVRKIRYFSDLNRFRVALIICHSIINLYNQGVYL